MPFWRDPAGRAGAVVLLLEDHPLDQRRVAAVVLLGPATRPTSGPRRASPPTPGGRAKPSAVSIDGSGSAGTFAASQARASAWKASSDSDRSRSISASLQLGLEHLAGQVAGERVDELDLARHLEVGQPLLGERDHVVLGERRAVPRTTYALPTSPSRSSGTPTTATSATPVERAQRLLDLGRVDVEAAGDVHVLEPVGDRQVAVLVERADVAGVQPAVGVDRLARWPPGRRGSRASRSRRGAAARRLPSSASMRVSMPGIARPQVVATVSAESPSRHIVATTASVIPNAVTTWSMPSLGLGAASARSARPARRPRR